MPIIVKTVNAVENTIHFFTECPTYNYQRWKLSNSCINCNIPEIITDNFTDSEL